MAPEYFEDITITNKVDVLSFVCILYEMIFKKLAFESNSFHELSYSITHKRPTIPKSDFSEHLSQIFETNPQTRPSISEIHKKIFKKEIEDSIESNLSQTLSEFIQKHFPQNMNTKFKDYLSCDIFEFALSLFYGTESIPNYSDAFQNFEECY
jgi:serine/threonine protein kinase